MQQGLGRCAIALRSSENIEKYKEIVLWGCLHNLAFDRQCEGTRAVYVYELASYFRDDEYFVVPLINAFRKLPRYADWLFAHECELLCLFGESGSEKAKNALQEKYDQLLPVLRAKKYFRSYDFEREAFERLCISLTSLGGTDIFLKIAEDLASLFRKNPHYNAEAFDWFYEDSERKFGKRKTRRIFEKTFRQPAEIPDAGIIVSETVTAGELSPSSEIRFSRNAAEEEKANYALEMLLTNYRPEDKAVLLSGLSKLTVDYEDESDWHAVGLKILDAYQKKVRLPKECLLYIYETTLCSCCREYAVRELAKHRWLTADIIEECRFDSNSDISEYVNRYYPCKM